MKEKVLFKNKKQIQIKEGLITKEKRNKKQK